MTQTVLAILLRIIANPFANVFQKQLTWQQKISPFFINFITYFLLGIATIPFATRIDWMPFSLAFWSNAIVVGLIGAIGNGFLVAAMQRGELSVLGPINAYKSVVGILFGIFLLGELPGIAGCIGVALIIYGSYYIFNQPVRKEMSPKPLFAIMGRRDIQFRVLAMVLAAIEAVFIKRVIQLSNTEVAMITWCWFGTLFSLLVSIFFCHDLRNQISKCCMAYKNILFLIIAVGVMQLSTNYAFKLMHVGYALACFQLSSLVSLFLGYFYFNEKEMLRKLIGALIMVIGSVMIILG